MGSRCELAKTATTQNPESEQDKNQIDKQLDQQIKSERATRNMENWRQ